LRELVSALEARGLFALHVSQREDGSWFAILETEQQYSAPEPNIADFVTAIESLPETQREQWLGCSQREFNIGYQSGPGAEPQGHTISSVLLARAVSVQASLALTVYPSGERA